MGVFGLGSLPARQHARATPSARRRVWFLLLLGMAWPGIAGAEVVNVQEWVIADVATGGMRSSLGTTWGAVTDTVMGGVSRARVGLEEVDGRRCLRLTGEVRLENSGGFVQAGLDLDPDDAPLDASGFTGVRLRVRGNGETYGLHLRTRDLWFPWQSYRASFTAPPAWTEVRLPFAAFTAYRTGKPLDSSRLARLGVFAIGRAFTADICVAEVALYR